MIFALLLAAAQPSPGSLDALVAAPRNHERVFENGRVRVLRVTVPPGATEPMHTHAWSSVMVVTSPEPIDYIVYAQRNGRYVEVKRMSLPAAKKNAPIWFGPEAAHAIKNRGKALFEALRTELKTQP